MPARVKIDPEKMTHRVRELYELSLVKNLSPPKLAPILNFSAVQIYRWYAGDAPKPGSEQLIKLGCKKIQELPDFLVPEKASWGRLWIHDEEERKQEAAEKKFRVQMKRLFDQLQNKATAQELAVVFPNRDFWQDVWLNFDEVMFVLWKHGIKVPKF